eukprot:TRINITY_DN40626_c0_g1_i3.p1 TRINITY_DN40626_c0_g1~~TRINITY_DN40626_c0_g1_i3.p1  ORF type:complete len:305 (-),score=42.64 TRINITY_DN40626_c0_g1_i3:716-1630(-)
MAQNSVGAHSHDQAPRSTCSRRRKAKAAECLFLGLVLHLALQQARGFAFPVRSLSRGGQTRGFVQPQRGLTTARGAQSPPAAAAKPSGPDYTGKAEALFNHVRIPAMLLAGVTFGAAFGMPLNTADRFGLAMLKRSYVLLNCTALAAQLVAVVASTTGILKLNEGLSAGGGDYGSPLELLQDKAELQWVAALFNFLAGLVLFVAAVALRSVTSIECPSLARACLCLFVAAVSHMLSLINHELLPVAGASNLASLGARYAQLLAAAVTRDWLNGGVFVGVLGAIFYAAKCVAHVYHSKILDPKLC